MKLLSILIATSAVLAFVPIASAWDVPPAAASTIAVSDNGGLSMACLGPFFTDCSLALAVAFGGCFDVKVKTVCLSATGGVIGGLSGLALNGGGANGHVNTQTLSCTWSGLSGGCARGAASLDLGCRQVYANSVGHLRLPAPVPVVANAGVQAPPANDRATPCSEHAAPIFAGVAGSRATAEAQLSLHASADDAFASARESVSTLPTEVAAIVAPALDELENELRLSIDGFRILDDGAVVFGEAVD